jgi:hypothetical protein
MQYGTHTSAGRTSARPTTDDDECRHFEQHLKGCYYYCCCSRLAIAPVSISKQSYHNIDAARSPMTSLEADQNSSDAPRHGRAVDKQTDKTDDVKHARARARTHTFPPSASVPAAEFTKHNRFFVSLQHTHRVEIVTADETKTQFNRW